MRPSHFVERPSGEKIPLVAVDELPDNVKLEGMKDILTAQDTRGMISCGVSPRRVETWVLQEESAPPAPKPAPEVLQEVSTLIASIIADPKVPHAHRNHIQQLVHRGVDLTSIVGNENMVVAIAGSQNANQARTRRGQVGQVGQLSHKQYCSFWMRRGECDYHQQGCVFKHEMPESMEQLAALGLREIPRWYRDMHGLPSLYSELGIDYAFFLLAEVQRSLRKNDPNSLPQYGLPPATAVTYPALGNTPSNAVVSYPSFAQSAPEYSLGPRPVPGTHNNAGARTPSGPRSTSGSNHSRFLAWRASVNKETSQSLHGPYGASIKPARRTYSVPGSASTLAASSEPFVPSKASNQGQTEFQIGLQATTSTIVAHHVPRGSQTGSEAGSQALPVRIARVCPRVVGPRVATSQSDSWVHVPRVIPARDVPTRPQASGWAGSSMNSSHNGSRANSETTTWSYHGSQAGSQTGSQRFSQGLPSVDMSASNIWANGSSITQLADFAHHDFLNSQIGAPPTSGNSERSGSSRFWDANGSFKYDGTRH